MRLLFLFLALGACAEAGKASIGGRPDGNITVADSSGSNAPPIDAFESHIDAPPGMQTKTLDENTSDTLVQNTAPACGNAAGTDVNTYYRVFDLATNGITTDFHVTQVAFQVDASGGQTVQVKVGTYNGTPGTTLATGSMAVAGSNLTVTVPSTTTGASVTAPITNAVIQGSKKLYVEIDSPAGGTLYMGANSAGESAPGYIMAPACSINVPTNISSVSATYPAVHLLITVTGTY